jgi:hypothetical protein
MNFLISFEIYFHQYKFEPICNAFVKKIWFTYEVSQLSTMWFIKIIFKYLIICKSRNKALNLELKQPM